MRSRIVRPASGSARNPVSRRLPFSSRAEHPRGTVHPPSSRCPNARSAVSSARAAASSRGASTSDRSERFDRASIARAPCPGGGTHQSAPRGAPIRAASSVPKRRSSPAAATMAASTSPSSTLRRRVSMLPRKLHGLEVAAGLGQQSPPAHAGSAHLRTLRQSTRDAPRRSLPCHPRPRRTSTRVRVRMRSCSRARARRLDPWPNERRYRHDRLRRLARPRS